MDWKAVAAVFFLGVLLFGCTQPGSGKTTSTPTPGGSGGYGGGGSASGEGRAVFALKDAAADLQSVSSVKMTVDKVQVHSASQGWVTVASEQKTYDLLELKSQSAAALMADAKLPAGTYQQMRLEVSSVVVTDANGTSDAKLPSGELKFVGDLVVKANETSAATFDFIADESLHVTGKGEYVMAPVVKVETREDADVSVQSNNRVTVSGGKVRTSIKVGMDIDGNLGVGLGLPADVNLTIGNNGVIGIGGQGALGIGIRGSGSASGSGQASGNVGIGASGSATAGASGSGDASGNAGGSASGSASGSGSVSGILGGT